MPEETPPKRPKIGGRKKGSKNKGPQKGDLLRDVLDLRLMMRGIRESVQTGTDRVYHYYSVPGSTNLVSREGRIGLIIKDIERTDVIMEQMGRLLKDEVPGGSSGMVVIKSSKIGEAVVNEITFNAALMAERRRSCEYISKELGHYQPRLEIDLREAMKSKERKGRRVQLQGSEPR